MKGVLILGLTFFSVNSFADWTESVKCSVERGSVDDLTVVSSSSDAQLKMGGPHNGETGKTILENSLIPSYTVTFSKVSGGRNDKTRLTTTIRGKVVAMSSVDTQQSEDIANRFITENGDYQITVTCSSAN